MFRTSSKFPVIGIMLAVLITACIAAPSRSNDVTPPYSSASPSPSPPDRNVPVNSTLTLIPTVPATSPKVTSRPVVTSSTPAMVSIQQICPERTGSTEKANFGGTIILIGGSSLSAFSFSDNRLHVIPNSAGASAYIGISPDEKRLAFHTTQYDPHGLLVDEKLWVTQELTWTVSDSSNGWDQTWSEIESWISKDTILLKMSSLYPEGSYAALNLSTGFAEKLVPSYLPGIYFNASDREVDQSPSWIAEYDPALTRVAYLQDRKQDGFPAIVLWDLQADKQLWRFSYQQAHHMTFRPRWSPDGNWLAVAGQLMSMNDVLANKNRLLEQHYELFLISKNGQASQITNFSGAYQKAVLSDLSWSPNGQYLSFWLQSEPGDSSNHLIVFDLESWQMTDYCLYSSELIRPTIWSPDSHQLATNCHSEDCGMVILDIFSKRVFDFPKESVPDLSNLEPIGWMATTP
jgi:hypothetical protein